MNVLWRYWGIEATLGGVATWLTYTHTSWMWTVIPVAVTLCLMGVTLYAALTIEPIRQYREHGEDYAGDTMYP